MRQSPRTRLMGSLPPASSLSASQWLCGTILGVSLISALTDRKWGIGQSLLRFDAQAILDGEPWRLITYPFVQSAPFGLVLSLVVLWLLGGQLEARWGAKDFLKFFLYSAVGAAVLAIPFGMLVNAILPFRDLGIAEGPGAAINAMLVAAILSAPNSNVLLGFVLPVPARQVVFILLGFEIISGILTGVSGLSVTLGGLLMGYFLSTGNWRPQRWWDGWQRRRGKSRRGLYVVPPPDSKRHQFHFAQ